MPRHAALAAGPLPATWLSEKQSLKNLIILELQSNKMGYAVWGVGAKKRLPRTTSWCVRGAAAAGSWCPREDNPPVYMPKLAKLDIGNNFLRGKRSSAFMSIPVQPARASAVGWSLKKC